jgi:hypothetical protein
MEGDKQGGNYRTAGFSCVLQWVLLNKAIFLVSMVVTRWCLWTVVDGRLERKWLQLFTRWNINSSNDEYLGNSSITSNSHFCFHVVDRILLKQAKF